MNRLDGKVALITGGASGLGQGMARRFLEEGARVVISDVNEDAGAQTAEDLGCAFFAQDVADEAAWQLLVQEVEGRFQRLDILVNNAGVFSSCPIDEMTLTEWQRVLDINLTGVFLGCKHGVAAMKRNADPGGGSIINISSVVGLRGQVGGAAYSASKWGVRLLTKTVAMENARRGIRCNSIHPGVIDTPIMDPIFSRAPDPNALREQIAAQLPIGHLGDPARDIGNMAVYLAADESRYVTGAEMVVDGGMTAGLPTG